MSGDKSNEYGHSGKHSKGMGNDGGADGSHESTRGSQRQNQRIHTGHPDELERFHRDAGNNR